MCSQQIYGAIVVRSADSVHSVMDFENMHIEHYFVYNFCARGDVVGAKMLVYKVADECTVSCRIWISELKAST